jgi:predicted amidophosphoribosyltransferase
VLAELLALIAPPLCLGCRAPVAARAVALCAACARGLPWLGTRTCRRCALPQHGGRACPAAAARYATAWAPVAYQGTALALVRALKFRGALHVAELMAAQMAANAPPWATADAEAVVAVPPAPGRARRRGFDPATLIATGLSRRLDLPSSACLTRSGEARQLGARRSERRAPGRIAVVATAQPPPRVLLVDDVHTTGATLAAGAAALVAAGARTVHALTYARTL